MRAKVVEVGAPAAPKTSRAMSSCMLLLDCTIPLTFFRVTFSLRVPLRCCWRPWRVTLVPVSTLCILHSVRVSNAFVEVTVFVSSYRALMFSGWAAWGFLAFIWS